MRAADLGRKLQKLKQYNYRVYEIEVILRQVCICPCLFSSLINRTCWFSVRVVIDVHELCFDSLPKSCCVCRNVELIQNSTVHFIHLSDVIYWERQNICRNIVVWRCWLITGILWINFYKRPTFMNNSYLPT